MKKYSTQNPNPIDKVVGVNLRYIRKQNKCSQGKLAEHLDITFQQVQKYENATNRISASKLYEIANYFGVSILDFYIGV